MIAKRVPPPKGHSFLNIKYKIKNNKSFCIYNYFRNFGFAELTLHSEMKRKVHFSFAFLSFFSNFARFHSFSLYKVDEMIKFCVDAIIDFAKSGSGCRGGNHGSYFYDEESSAIKALMFKFARLAATSIEHVAQWLVWLAKELGQLTNMELHRADTEVRDIVEGKYDWRIERFENHRGDGLSV